MEFIPKYIARMHGEEKIEYLHPSLMPIFKETFGFPVYQEQLMYAAMNLAGYSAPEADDLRKAISKKMKDKLLKHREKFVSGCLLNGIRDEVAGAIFDEWEEFARYGFNKSHAVDYGVIAVQTAYLKLHYPLEYMTALMSVSKNDTAKVALYVADCRRMGVEVAPPDVNNSEWDFSIEDHSEGKSSIRFGLGAVKNVGSGPVEVILKARQSQPFLDLNDFCRRVDLRQVGKRALESLIKVGAFDQFGARTTLLESMDRMVSVSTSHFRAKEVGQMSLFGLANGMTENLVLPQSTVEISRREILNWEKELIGLYVSDHPLSPVMDLLTQLVTHFSGQLPEAGPQERVRIAGIISHIRFHQSKAGKPMAFVKIEDLQGSVDLVIFPKVWERVSHIVQFDKIVLVDGRVDMDGSEPKVLVDNLTSELSLVTTVDDSSLNISDWSFPQAKDPQDLTLNSADKKQAPVGPSNKPPSQKPSQSSVDEVALLGEILQGEVAWDDSIPPPPEEFPMDWEYQEMFQKTDEETRRENPPEDPSRLSKPERKPDTTDQKVTEDKPAKESILSADPPPVISTIKTVNPENEEVDAPSNFMLPTTYTYYLPMSTGEGTEDDQAVRMLTVVFRSTGDKTRDVLRLRRIHGIVSSYPGKDRFAFLVFERGHGYLLEFPNYTAGICNEMLNRIRPLIGVDNLRIEVIKIQ
jgi:DNA polymerase-3 subunit alpha